MSVEPGSNSSRWPFRTRGIPTDGVSDDDNGLCVRGHYVFNMPKGCCNDAATFCAEEGSCMFNTAFLCE